MVAEPNRQKNSHTNARTAPGALLFDPCMSASYQVGHDYPSSTATPMPNLHLARVVCEPFHSAKVLRRCAATIAIANNRADIY